MESIFEGGERGQEPFCHLLGHYAFTILTVLCNFKVCNMVTWKIYCKIITLVSLVNVHPLISYIFFPFVMRTFTIYSLCACNCHAQSLSCVQLFCDPMDCSLPGSSVYGIPQAKILEWVAISSSRGSSQPRDQIHVSCITWTGRWVPFTTVPLSLP